MKTTTKYLLTMLFCLGWTTFTLGGPKRHIDELFLMLPKAEFLEGSPKELMEWFQRGVLDVKNGFMSLKGDGAQCSLQAALFRFSDGRPLLAISYGLAEEGNDFIDMDFYVESKDGKQLVLAKRDIFPVAADPGLHFYLPRQGRTVLVKNDKGKVVAQATWNGSKFVLAE